MVTINNSEIVTVLDVKMNDKIIKATVAEKPFYDPKKSQQVHGNKSIYKSC